MSTTQRRSSEEPPRHHAVPPAFSCAVSNRGFFSVWMEASGELDLATAPELDRALQDATSSARLVVLDLRALTFISAAGVRVIERAGRRVLEEGGRFVVTQASAEVARALSLIGTPGAVEVLDLELPETPRRRHLRLAR